VPPDALLIAELVAAEVNLQSDLLVLALAFEEVRGRGDVEPDGRQRRDDLPEQTLARRGGRQPLLGLGRQIAFLRANRVAGTVLEPDLYLA
jgi:hypothetical protein